MGLDSGKEDSGNLGVIIAKKDSIDWSIYEKALAEV